MLKKFLLIMLLLFCSNLIFTDEYHEKADEFYNKAKELEKQHQYAKAAEMYKTSAKYENNSPKPRKKKLGLIILKAGEMYDNIGQFHEAFKL